MAAPTQVSSSINNKITQQQNDKKLIELINGLRLAIQNGEIQSLTTNNKSSTNESLTNRNIANSSFANVNNLSNQTFNYIINWLKQQSQTNEVNINKIIFLIIEPRETNPWFYLQIYFTFREINFIN